MKTKTQESYQQIFFELFKNIITIGKFRVVEWKIILISLKILN